MDLRISIALIKIKKKTKNSSILKTDDKILREFKNFYTDFCSNQLVSVTDGIFTSFVERKKKWDKNGYQPSTERVTIIAFKDLHLKKAPETDEHSSSFCRIFIDVYVSSSAKVFSF